jgi:hypothetical protein
LSEAKNRPDSYAENAGLLPYGSNVSAPAIQVPDINLFKTERGSLARNYFEDRIRSLEEAYQQLQQHATDTQTVYNSKYNFVPRVGKIYHLYESAEGNMLSLIEPECWNKKYLNSFIYTHDSTWERIEWPIKKNYR